MAYHFHDYRADGLTEQQLRGFIAQLGWEPLLNTRGTTWRKLDEAQRNACDNADAAIALMLAQPAIIKRPLLDDGNGHAPARFQRRRLPAIYRRGRRMTCPVIELAQQLIKRPSSAQMTKAASS